CTVTPPTAPNQPRWKRPYEEGLTLLEEEVRTKKLRLEALEEEQRLLREEIKFYLE
ncbi:hypothetical protein DFQ29_003794, partial [Apophysomyces sp. BC1021]